MEQLESITIENKAVKALLDDDINLNDPSTLITEGLKPWTTNYQLKKKQKKYLERTTFCSPLRSSNFKNQNSKKYLSQNNSEEAESLIIKKNGSINQDLNNSAKYFGANSQQESLSVQFIQQQSSNQKYPSHLINNKKLILMNKFNRINRKKQYSQTERRQEQNLHREFLIDNKNFSKEQIEKNRINSNEKWINFQKNINKNSFHENLQSKDIIPQISSHIKQPYYLKQKNNNQIEELLVNRKVQSKSQDIQNQLRFDNMNKYKFLKLIKQERQIKNNLRQEKIKKIISLDLIYSEFLKGSHQRYKDINDQMQSKDMNPEKINKLDNIKNLELTFRNLNSDKKVKNKQNKKNPHIYFGLTPSNKQQQKFHILGKISHYLNDHGNVDIQQVLNYQNRYYNYYDIQFLVKIVKLIKMRIQNQFEE